MHELNDRERELVAIGASIASNCVSCIEYHVPQAKGAGLEDSQIKEAVEIADRVRRVPARKVLHAARARLKETSCGPVVAAEEGCGCAESAATR